MAWYQTGQAFLTFFINVHAGMALRVRPPMVFSRASQSFGRRVLECLPQLPQHVLLPIFGPIKVCLGIPVPEGGSQGDHQVAKRIDIALTCGCRQLDEGGWVRNRSRIRARIRRTVRDVT